MHAKVKKIKVCFISPKAYEIFNPAVGDYVGGAEVDLYFLATEFARDCEFEVSCVVADYGQNDVEKIEDVTVIKSLNFRKNVLNSLLRTWRALKQANADVYVMKCASAGVALVALFCKKFSRTFVYRTAHRHECDGTYLRQHFLTGRMFAWGLHQAKAVFTQNKTDSANLHATIGVPSTPVPNGHRLPPVHHQTRETILWVGRDHPIKQPELFLELARAVPGEQFIMICQNPAKDRHFQNLTAEAGKIPNLQFIEHVPFNQIDAYFQRTKVFVSTSIAEGFPNTFIHSCKSSVAILSLNVNPDGFLNAYGCGLCCNGDTDRLTYNLRSMLENNRYLEFGSNARKYAQMHHDITKIVAEYKSVFTRLIKKL
jgi:glycosyltransferase involved in cell wall biosynthesis